MYLDLHQTRHADVAKKVHEYLIKLSQQSRYFNGCIITGNSREMKRLVKNELNKHNWVSYIDNLKPGVILITGN